VIITKSNEKPPMLASVAGACRNADASPQAATARPTMLLVIALSVFSIGTYLVWPSRWNIPAHINVGFVLTAYVVAGLLTDSLKPFPPSLVEFFQMIMVVGAGAFVIGMVIGAALPHFKILAIPFSFASLDESELITFVSRRVIWLGLISIAGIAISFRIMGFIPMFAEDPLVAKYLRGSYQDTYRQVAVLYRGSEQVIVVTLPLVLILFYTTRRLVFATIGLTQMALMSLTLIRGYFGFPLMLAGGVIAVYRGSKTIFVYMLIVVFSVAVASASSYYIWKAFFPQDAANFGTSVWDEIASGTPDISDNLTFLRAFEEHREWTYGRTFIGGLVPFHYRWNPAIWSLRVEADDPDLDANEVLSGGLRLPPPVVGYAAFGWPGVVLVSLLSGLAAGYMATFARANVGLGSPLRTTVVLGIYNIIGFEFVNFYMTSIYAVFAVCIMLIFTYPISLKMGAAPTAVLEPG
jgi:hypothetical protein